MNPRFSHENIRSAKIGRMDEKPKINTSKVYAGFNAPIQKIDCGQICAVHNPNGLPFCCDICHAIPAVYLDEWEYLKNVTDLWHQWKVEECGSMSAITEEISDDLPETMILLACKGVLFCERQNRSLACRQFPFFPYVTDDFRFIGLAYEWKFENQCWVISHLDQVSKTYRDEFINTFDEIFNLWPEEMESYANKSEEMRSVFRHRKQRIPILHRNGKDYLLSPNNEKILLSTASKFRKFDPYQSE